MSDLRSIFNGNLKIFIKSNVQLFASLYKSVHNINRVLLLLLLLNRKFFFFKD
jgi:hypothetical protein